LEPESTVSRSRVILISLIALVASLALLSSVMLIYGVVCGKEMDNGLAQKQLDSAIVDMTPASAPKNGALWTVHADKGVPPVELAKAIAAWNVAVGDNILAGSVNPDFFAAGDMENAVYRLSTIAVSAANLSPSKLECGGTVTHAFRKGTAEVMWTDIVVGNEWLRSKPHIALTHLLGHALLLDHDDFHDTSIMRHSIYTIPLSFEVLKTDAQLLRNVWKQAKQKRRSSN